ncbi:hypothetical protein AWC38_SpisGene8673 [Stylophora pistillata]|uniref:Reverse transcriptase domain-containing protein n=1 Tax=Stylophora pistillata TaxID=50429 RepID=A0A2B4SC07_STYPI|nr:hypothetical protein AWC38_SpisGene8673 [Stylophora pistillata]
MASCLIPLDKGEGMVRPIGVGEVLRRVLAKCVMNVAKEDVAEASGSLQLCAGQKSGSEAAVHAMHPAWLFITDGKEILSAEGTTQGDPLAMGVYALSIQPLITALQTTSSTKQCWFADDASRAGPLGEVKKWWDTLTTIGPAFGYFPNARKCCIVVKPEKEESAKDVFKSTAINITSKGHKHLGAVIGSQEC